MSRFAVLLLVIAAAAGAGVFFSGGPKPVTTDCAKIADLEEQRECFDDETTSRQKPQAEKQTAPSGGQ